MKNYNDGKEELLMLIFCFCIIYIYARKLNYKIISYIVCTLLISVSITYGVLSCSLITNMLIEEFDGDGNGYISVRETPIKNNKIKSLHSKSCDLGRFLKHYNNNLSNSSALDNIVKMLEDGYRGLVLYVEISNYVEPELVVIDKVPVKESQDGIRILAKGNLKDILSKLAEEFDVMGSYSSDPLFIYIYVLSPITENENNTIANTLEVTLGDRITSINFRHNDKIERYTKSGSRKAKILLFLSGINNAQLTGKLNTMKYAKFDLVHSTTLYNSWSLSCNGFCLYDMNNEHDNEDDKIKYITQIMNMGIQCICIDHHESNVASAIRDVFTFDSKAIGFIVRVVNYIEYQITEL